MHILNDSQPLKMPTTIISTIFFGPLFNIRLLLLTIEHCV